MKRQKEVFSSNSELAHAWANQTHPRGRANNMYFEGVKLYSYGSHFLLAEIHEKKGQKIAVINSRRYSVTTCKHRMEVWRAVNGLMPNFESPDPSDLRCTKNWMDSCVVFAIDAALGKLKVTSKDDIKYRFETISNSQKERNKLRKFLGLKPKFVPTKTLNKVQKHLENRLKRYHELNTPEAIEKKRIQKEKREAAKQRLRLQKLEADVAAWRQGEHRYSVRSLSPQLLRVKEDRIETSGGASVPLNAAKELLNSILDGKGEGLILAQTKLAGFQLYDIQSQPDGDTLLIIGCHRILLSEAKSVLNLNQKEAV